jgi:hypothetical protein
MIRIAIIVVIMTLVAGIGTFSRYRSFDPCVWLKQDMMARAEQPAVVVEARIAARFLVDGIVDPSFGNCLEGWWSYRLEDLPGD